MTEFGRVITQNEHNLHNGNFAFVERSRTMKAPVGLLSDRTVLRSKMEGLCPDKFAFVERSGTMKAPVGLLSDRTVLRKQDGGASPRQVPVCRTALNSRKAPAFQNGCRGFLFVYFNKMISPFSSASTTRVLPDARLPSIRRSAAGSSTALRITRRRSRAPNLPP